MQRPAWALVAAALACMTPAAARADEAADLAQIRQQIQQLKQEYEARIGALEKRLATTEQQAEQAQSAAKSVAQQQRGNAFNPPISMILQGRYASLSQDPATYRIGGFIPSGGQVDPGKRGMSLTESELVFSATADPYFSGTLIASLAPDGGIDVENGYLETNSLSDGWTLKAGRFFSKIGYQNEQHSHAWDFIDAPLPYRAFLGGQLADDGVQAKWVAPTDLLVELGAEAGRGRSFPGNDRDKNGVALGTLFGHIGGDIGVSQSWRAGLSYLQTSPDARPYDDLDATGNNVTNAFTGRSKLWLADAVWKWAPNGNPYYRNFKLQGEYFRRDESGTLVFDTPGVALPGTYSSSQSGWYGQAVYQFLPRWRVGLRYDRLDSGAVDIGQVDSGAMPASDFPILAPYTPTLATAMVDYSPSEFSRVRLQLARDKSRPDATDNQLFIQYILSLGTHGAHTW
ncbi:MAG: hypothetical protein WCA17_11315 [Burkholderiales bacterium]